MTEERMEQVTLRFIIIGMFIGAFIGLIFPIDSIVNFLDYSCVFLSFLMFLQTSFFGGFMGLIVAIIVGVCMIIRNDKENH